jgi:hypothetical protein
MSSDALQQRILNALQNGILTWNDLKGAANCNDEKLGLTLGALLNLRKIWTVDKNDVRVYGLEKRLGLVPRYAHPQRRSTD